MFDWQTIIALVIVSGAVGTICYRGWKKIFALPSSGCGTRCRQCPSSTPHASKMTELIQLGNESTHAID
jgi:hypothetical protein